MDRRHFIRSCGTACLGGVAVAGMLQACATTKTISGEIVQSNLVVELSEFELVRKGETSYRKFLIVQHPSLHYPICVYRFSETDYSALLMQCTHQGAELQVFGDRLQCPAHGSEFTNRGQVENGPAAIGLRSFPVQVVNHQLMLSLI